MSLIKYTTGYDRFEAAINRTWRWRNDADRFKEFCIWLGNQNKKALESGMSAHRAGLSQVINHEKSLNDLEKLELAWDEFLEDLRRRQQAEAQRQHVAVTQVVPPAGPKPETREGALARLRAKWAFPRYRQAVRLECEQMGFVIGHEGPMEGR